MTEAHRTAAAKESNRLKRQKKLALDLQDLGWFVAPPASKIQHPQLYPEWAVSAEVVQEALDEWQQQHA